MNIFFKIAITLVISTLSFNTVADTKNEVMGRSYVENTKPFKLSTGEVIQLEQLTRVFVSKQDDWILILNYRTDTLDKTELRRKADLIWERFKVRVEKDGFKYAGIHAKKYSVENPKETDHFKGYNLVLIKDDNGKWNYVESKK